MASGKDRILSQGPQRKVLTEEQTARSVVVTNISHQTSDSAIVIYFQQAKNGGGELDHVHIPQKGKAVITFANIQVAEKTLQHPHKIDGSELKIHRLANKEPVKVFQRVEARLDLDPLRSFEEFRQNMIDPLKEVESHRISHNAIILSGSVYQVRAAQDKLRQLVMGLGVIAGSENSGGSGYNQRISSSGRHAFFSESPNIFEVQPQFMKLLKQVYKKTLREMEDKFGVEILWEENASKVCVRQGKTSKGNHRFKEGCEQFIDLYKNFHLKVSREVVHLPREVKETVVDETIVTVKKDYPVIFEKVENTVVVYAEKDSIRSYVQALKEKLRFSLHSSRTSKVTSQNTLQDQENQQLQPFSGTKPLVQVLKNGVTLSVCRGDVTNVQVDAIVNAANEFLQHGAGVAGAIVRKGGSQIQDESNMITRSRGHLSVGEAVATSGGRLPCRYVIHTVGPRWNEHGMKASISLLHRACLESLNLAALELQLSSIALTAISSGIFGMPNDICAQVIFKAVEEFSESQNAEFSTLRDVRIVIIDEPTIRVFSEEFIKRYNSNKASPGIVVNPEMPINEDAQTSIATNPAKENDVLSSVDKEMQCNEKVNLDTATGKAASIAQDSYEATLSDKLKNMSLSSEEGKENASSGSNLKTEKGSKVDPSPVKSSCSLNNNATGKPPCGRGRGMLAPRFKSSSGTEMSHNALFHGKSADGNHTKNANTGSPAPGLAVTEEGKKLAKQLKDSIEDDNSADVTDLVRNVTESSSPNPQDAKHSHESQDKENANRYEEYPKEGSSDGGQGNDATLNQSLSNLADTSLNYVQNGRSVPDVNAGDVKQPKTSACENDINSSSSETRENVEEVLDKTTKDSNNSGISSVAKSLENSQGMFDGSNPDGSIPHHATETPLVGEDTGTRNMQGDPSHGPESGRRDHFLCKSCCQALSLTNEFCPQCKKEGVSQGNQPTGRMTWISDEKISLPGYHDFGVVMVQFFFDKGIQGPEHPNPGQPYNASTTTCYLPFNREGEEVCSLLQKAFEAKVLFTIEKDKIESNGIELITDRLKGPPNNGNPTPGYLDRVRGQLAKLGITVPQM